jgi:hypothetical protein
LAIKDRHYGGRQQSLFEKSFYFLPHTPIFLFQKLLSLLSLAPQAIINMDKVFKEIGSLRGRKDVERVTGQLKNCEYCGRLSFP